MKLVIAIALVAMLGCEKSSEGPPLEPIRHDGVRMISLGTEVRRTLQYRLERGARTSIELAMDLDLDLGRSIKMPTIVMTMELAVEDVLATGAARVASRTTRVKVIDRPGVTLGAATVEPIAQAITGLGYTFLLSPDGSVSDGKVTGTAPGELQAQLGDMTRAIEQVVMRLPPVPVGVGARWSAHRTIQQNGIELAVVTTTELVGIDGDTMSFTSQTTLSAPDQQIAQPGMKVDVKDVGGSGTGKGTIKLTTMAMVGELTSQFRGTLTTGGNTTAMNVAMQLRLK